MGGRLLFPGMNSALSFSCCECACSIVLIYFADVIALVTLGTGTAGNALHSTANMSLYRYYSRVPVTGIPVHNSADIDMYCRCIIFVQRCISLCLEV